MAEIDILYFAWLRERAGASQERISPPSDVRTVGQLMAWLAERNEALAEAFATPGLVRAAVNQKFATRDDLVSAGDEVAFFPPVTGG